MKTLLFLAFIGYFLGSIPFALLFAKLGGVRDLHRRGSGNSGASNVLRTVGKWLAMGTALCDFAKGFVPLLMLSFIFPLLPLPLRSLSLLCFQAVLSAGILLGHVFPLYFRFRGGKGMASAAGAASAIFPLAAPFCLAVFVAVLGFSRRASLASLCTAWCLVPYYLFLRSYFPVALSPEVAKQGYVWLFLGFALFLTWSHRSNVKRLLQGRERPLWGR